MMAAEPPDAPGTTKAAFARRLRSIMAQRGLSAAETVRRMRDHLPGGVSQSSLFNYLSGRSMPRLRYLDALSAALGVDRSELLPEFGAGEEPRPLKGRRGPAKPEGGEPPRVLPSPEIETIRVEDFGDEVHLRIDQRVSWEVALKIMGLLKSPGEDG